MADFALNLDPLSAGYGQLLVVDGAFVLTDDADARGTSAVANRLKKRFGLFTGEFFLNTSEGTPWLQSVLVKGGRKDDADAVMMDRILGTPGVLSLIKYRSSFDSGLRNFTATFTVTAIGGNIEMQVTNPIA